MLNISRRPIVFTALACGLLAPLLHSNGARAFDRIQPPEIETGKRAGLAGTLAGTAYGPSDVSRGGFSLPLPIDVPKDRGAILASVFPTYDPDNGLSVWGMGFGTSLAITRFRLSGSLSYDFDAGDELTGPFGRLTRGTDGDWYPIGLDKAIRVKVSGDDLVAYLPDGTQWTFGGVARITNAKGTYAWSLREVKDPTGRTTTLTWTANASGNLFLAQVAYGGIHEDAQYQIDLTYETVTTTDARGAVIPKFTDYRSGAALALDRRVSRVTVSARHAQTAVMAERWHYDLHYKEETVGAAFYLAELDKTFASGEAGPTVRYTYNLKGAGYDSVPMKEVPELTSLFTTLGVTTDVLQPKRGSVSDVDFNGNPDLEIADDGRTLVLQKGAGTAEDPLRFETAPLAPKGAACTTADQVGCMFDRCRPVAHTVGEVLAPRMLSQLNPTDDVVRVVDFQWNPSTALTAVSLCDREGTRLNKSVVAGQWASSDAVRFVDMNRDHLPDLLRVSAGRYEILPNASATTAGATAYAWGAKITGPLVNAHGLPITPIAAWVSDITGDGAADIVVETTDALQVWHGLGNFQFTPTAQELPLVNRHGIVLTHLDQYKLVPADLNKDGLQDYFVTNANTRTARFIMYFTNVGGKFVETPVSAFDKLPATVSEPVIATFDGSGNTSVTVTDSGKAYSIALEGPETGLMATADDGMGTVLSFQYARGPASPGIRHRYALLDRMDVQSSGYDVMSYDYRYEQPSIHTVGKFLLGFDRVTRRDGDLPSNPLATHQMTFLNEDRFAGLMLSSADTDVRAPSLVKVALREYEDATFVGIPWKRLKKSSEGWTSADGATSLFDVTTVDAYEADVCPAHTTRTSRNGTLETQTTRAQLPALGLHMHCMEGTIAESGHHSDPALDFTEQQTIARNAMGQVLAIQRLGGGAPWNEQTMTYDADGQIVTMASAGKGTATFTYDPVTKLLSRIVGADGVITEVTARDPLTDAVLTHFTDRGGASYNQYFAYDGEERLSAKWNDLTAATAASPNESYRYAYATLNTPASVFLRTLVDAATGSSKSSVELSTASNEKLGVASLIDSGWVFDGLTARSRRQRTVEAFQVASRAPGTDVTALDYASLFTGTSGGSPSRLRASYPSDFGFDASGTTELHSDVEMKTTSTMAIDGSGGLARVDTTAGALPTVTTLDARGKHTLGFTDEANTHFTYIYDALDRLRAVLLPDGTSHRVAYDEYGRVKSVTRDGIASIAYTYVTVPGAAPTTSDLVETQTFASAPSSGAPVPQRQVSMRYDAAGRKQVETHRDLALGTQKGFSYFYDGATPANLSNTSARGLVTAITGDGYAKTFAYRADGKPMRRTIDLTGWRTVSTDFAYRDDGSVRDQNVTVVDPAGSVVASSVRHHDVDAYGRVAQTTLNGAPLLSFAYDENGRPGTVTFGTGDTVSFAYDALTRQFVGMTQQKAGASFSGPAVSRFKKNTRGFIGEETFGIGVDAVRRTYTYGPQGFLVNASDSK